MTVGETSVGSFLVNKVNKEHCGYVKQVIRLIVKSEHKIYEIYIGFDIHENDCVFKIMNNVVVSLDDIVMEQTVTYHI